MTQPGEATGLTYGVWIFTARCGKAHFNQRRTHVLGKEGGGACVEVDCLQISKTL